MKEEVNTKIVALYEGCFHEKPLTVIELPSSGSNRCYFRVASDNYKALAAYNADRKENIAYLSFARHFEKYNLPVTKIFAEDLDNHLYLLEDLGDETLFAYLEKHRNEGFSQKTVALYKEVLDNLLRFQIDASADLDYSVCYPRAAFDRQSMMWDLNYFKYYFLKLAQISFDEQKLEDDFNVFVDYLLQADADYFMYRDFQSRNIMIRDNQLYFIDFQGGRKGALQYDVASLLYDAKAAIPQQVREELLNYYIASLAQKKQIKESEFRRQFTGFVLVRIMQAMGAYGFRGYYEKKVHFLKSIPYAVANLKWLTENAGLPVKATMLQDVFEQIIANKNLQRYADEKTARLTVRINSFSFKKGYPEDPGGNGGGFVFDCRALPNPGRYDEYKGLTGMDKPVIDYLEQEPETTVFFENTSQLVSQSVENYLKRGFTHLMVSYGCTGGQHRSVYFAEKLATYVREKFDAAVIVNHKEQNTKP
ncbi:MAG TPA: RNase adapter RapZ [Bacteroidales bacterium]|nr:RNase adapter RapZ [Bacteroidales bacterium]